MARSVANSSLSSKMSAILFSACMAARRRLGWGTKCFFLIVDLDVEAVGLDLAKVDPFRLTVTPTGAGLLDIVDKANEGFFADVFDENEDLVGFGLGTTAGLKPYPFFPLFLWN